MTTPPPSYTITRDTTHAWRKAHLKQAFDRRQMEEKNLSAHHKGERDFLFDEKEGRIALRREQIRKANRPQWAALYKRQLEQTRELFQAWPKAFSRLKYWLRHRDQTPGKGFLAGAIEAVTGRAQLHKALEHRHEADRKALAKDVRAQNLEAIRQENAVFRKELDHLKALQAKEKWSLQQAHSKESQDLAREIKAKSDEMRGERLTDEFMKRVRGRIRKARERGERGKGKGQGRERE